jgi:hypothetical protein
VSFDSWSGVNFPGVDVHEDDESYYVKGEGDVGVCSDAVRGEGEEAPVA